jgi:tetratricopeptide (TPR) repeat protein
VDSRLHLKALQVQVAAARAAFEAGNREKALEHIDQALSIDPSFLAAQALRERVLAGRLAPPALAPVSPNPPGVPDAPATPSVQPTPNVPATPSGPATRTAAARRVASREAYDRIELRAKQRRVDHCIAATRAALGRQQPEAAAAALAELIALEPHETNVASLSAELADLRRRYARRPFGVRLAAASAFLAVAGTASWLEHPRRPAPVPVATTVAARPPAAIEEISLESRAITAPMVTRPPESAPSSQPTALQRIPDDPPRVPDPVPSPPTPPRSIPVSAPTRTPAPTMAAATAPASTLSLPTPLSQLPGGGSAPAPAPAPLAPPPAAAITAGPAVVPATAPIRPTNDRDLVEEALQNYRRAYGRLNVQSAQAVYPTVNRVALARAFDSLESQSLTFDSGDVEVVGALAKAICHGTAHYVPKVGSRYPRTEPLVWSFELRKNDSDWTIFYAKASR